MNNALYVSIFEADSLQTISCAVAVRLLTSVSHSGLLVTFLNLA